MAKPSLAIVSLTGCTGCVVSILDLHEEILEVLDKVDLTYCTTLLDVKEIPKCDVALVDGTVANEADIAHAKEIREKANTVISLGSCACFGGITGLKNLFGNEKTLNTVYKEKKSMSTSNIPTDVPPLIDRVRTLDSIIDVDYKIPGCPPVPKIIKNTLVSLLEGKEPEIPTHNLCNECNRKQVKMLNPTKEFLTFQIHNQSQIDYDEELCFLEQGVLCIGFATREGCEGRCVNAGVSCRGCMGILEKEVDQGCSVISGLASIFPIGQLSEKEDFIGTFYRYTLPNSIIQKVADNKHGGK